jgi:hypothetical protein
VGSLPWNHWSVYPECAKDMAGMYDEVRAAVEQWPVLADESGVTEENADRLQGVFARIMEL